MQVNQSRRDFSELQRIENGEVIVQKPSDLDQSIKDVSAPLMKRVIDDPVHKREFEFTLDQRLCIDELKKKLEDRGNFDEPGKYLETDLWGFPRRIFVTWCQEETGAKRVAVYLLLNKKSEEDIRIGTASTTAKVVTNAIDCDTGKYVASLGMHLTANTINELERLKDVRARNVKGNVHLLAHFIYPSKKNPSIMKIRLIETRYKGSLDSIHFKSMKDKVSIAFQLADWMTNLHARSEIYRDFKPFQIMYRKARADEKNEHKGRCSVFVGDLETICSMDDAENERKQVHCTTVWYMSPEYTSVFAPKYLNLRTKEIVRICEENKRNPENKKVFVENYWIPASVEVAQVATPANDVWGLGCVLYDIFINLPLVWVYDKGEYLSLELLLRTLTTLYTTKEFFNAIPEIERADLLKIENTSKYTDEEFQFIIKVILMCWNPDPEQRSKASDVLAFIRSQM